ncbi:hypothetical protein ONS95_013039 [Cadophora gregata]|uniref:uncharacterized protein n=1 Tax=Cadophora gregata TaxID=51156 RepID=UPI0026DD5120|nr:uncharacterized protein ONS95_013039 [Cadophora gregata]KAK0116002.1 hypothetical protein ONS95_013039 [Cadophora gregata]
MVQGSDSCGGSYHFVTYTGAPITDRDARRLAKRNVMQHIHRSRKNALAVRRHKPLLYSLDVLHEFTERQATSSEPLDLDPSHTNLVPFNVPDNACCSASPQKDAVPDSMSTTVLLPGIMTMYRLGAGRGDPFLKFPINITPRSRELVDIIFKERGGKASPLKVAWFQISILDAAAFHQLLSGAATYFNNLRNGDSLQADEESLAHHTYSLQLINRQMRDVKLATTDGVISSIIGFACYYHLVGDLRSWKMHLDGLKEIVHSRGGIQTLNSVRFLRIMLSCIDISGSCTLDDVPNFPLAYPISTIQPSMPFSNLESKYRRISNNLAFTFRDNFALVELLVDLIRESSHLQSEIQLTEGKILMDSIYICDYTNPLLHRLLSLPRQKHASKVADMAEMIRLAAILYLIGIRQSFGIYPTRVTSQIRKLSVLLMTSETDSAQARMWKDRGLGCIQLWIIVVGGVLCDEKDGASWFAKHLHAAMHRMSVATYGDLEGFLKGFSWVDEIHGTLLKDFRRKLIT